MDTTAMVMLLILAILIVILAFRYRDRIRFGLKGPLGAGLDFEGQDRATGTAGASESERAQRTREENDHHGVRRA